MESYRVHCYYEVNGVEKRVRMNFATLSECRSYLSENRDIEVLSMGRARRVPFVRYEIVRLSEEVVDYGEVRQA